MKQRNHYAALDGLRGVAAFSVLLYHLGHWLNKPFLASNAGLAVDFFFCLSGYVLSVAYRARLDSGMTATAFMRIRLIRLMPMIVIGTLFSSAYLAVRVLFLHYPAPGGQLLLATVLGLLCLPNFWATQPIGGPQVFPLNGPQYTLFLEFVVNLVWAATKKAELLVLSLAIAAICFAAVAEIGIGGDEVGNFLKGLPRVFASFYAGVAIFHLQARYPVLQSRAIGRLFLPLTIVMLAVFYFPSPLTLAPQFTWILIGSPLLVLAGSQVRPEGMTERLALLSGELSYPIYALHYPIFVWVNGMYQELLHRRDFLPDSALTGLIVPLACYLLLQIYDKPVRSWLERRSAARRSATPPPSTPAPAPSISIK